MGMAASGARARGARAWRARARAGCRRGRRWWRSGWVKGGGCAACARGGEAVRCEQEWRRRYVDVGGRVSGAREVSARRARARDGCNRRRKHSSGRERGHRGCSACTRTHESYLHKHFDHAQSHQPPELAANQRSAHLSRCLSRAASYSSSQLAPPPSQRSALLPAATAAHLSLCPASCAWSFRMMSPCFLRAWRPRTVHTKQMSRSS